MHAFFFDSSWSSGALVLCKVNVPASAASTRPLSCVAVATTGTPFYNDRKTEYISSSPLIFEKEEVVKKYLGEVKAIMTADTLHDNWQ